MKKIIYSLVLIICFYLTFNFKAYAYSDDSISFIGEITAKYDLMMGDCPKVDDFNISGYIFDSKNNYSSYDIYLSWEDNDINLNQNTYKILLLDTNSMLSLYTSVTVNAIDFSPNLVSELDDNEYNISKVKEYSEDGFDVVHYSNKINKTVRNVAGKEISGQYKFSNNFNSPRIGYNVIVYKFIPFNRRYNTIYGNFVVYYDNAPKITTTATTLNVGLNNKNNSYKIKINDRWYKTTQIKNLKPNTTYEIKIVQNATEEYKSKVIYTKKIKTKKK